MTIATVTAARSARRLVRKLLLALGNGTCPACSVPIHAHLDGALDACVASACHWTVGELAERCRPRMAA